MNIAICDDEKIILEKIKSLVEKEKPDGHIESFVTGEELLASETNFDVIFLDIQMDGMNGIEAARALRRRHEDTVLIFVTAIREYVFEAFDVAAFHYLLKPIEERKFMAVFERAQREAEKQKRRGLESVFIKAGSRNITLSQSRILYIENRAKKLAIHTATEVLEIYAAMRALEEQLGRSFYRCHRGYLVNMAYIAEYGKDSITLNNGERIYLAKEKYNEFVKAYMRYLRNGVCADV